MKSSILSILFISVASVLWGQDVKISAGFDTSKIYIGDQTYYTITVERPSGLRLDLNTLKDTLCKNIEILSGPVSDSSVIDVSRVKMIRKYLVTSFDSGSYQVPPAFTEIMTESGMKRFYSDYAYLEVLRVKIAPPDTTARIFDIVPPYKAPLTAGEIVPWVLLALLAAAFIWAIVIMVRKLKKTGPVPVENITSDPAHIIAFRDLEKLKQEELWQKGEVKLYYSRLTGILRQYLENRFGIFSLEMTTSETLEALAKTGFKKDESYQNLKTILNGSDLVKFAKYKPEPEENELHFDNSWKFVETTKATEEVEGNVDTKDNKEEVS